MANVPFWLLFNEDDDTEPIEPVVEADHHWAEEVFSQMGMPVLTADKPEDIDKWPSLAFLFGGDDSAGDAR